LKREDGESAYTLGLDAHTLDRIAVAQFARDAREIGVDFIGLCCGAGPHHIRAMAEALGKEPAASRYSPDMSLHGLLGGDKVVQAHEKEYLASWK